MSREMDFPPIFPPLPRNVRPGVPEGPSRPERVILRPASGSGTGHRRGSTRVDVATR